MDVMYPELIHCWGPISIQSYGVMILIGVITFSYLFLNDPRRARLISTKQYFDLLSLSIIAALVGGRLLSIITQLPDALSWSQIMAPWEGGFSVLGSTIGVLIIIPLYLRMHHRAVLPLL